MYLKLILILTCRLSEEGIGPRRKQVLPCSLIDQSQHS